MILGEHAQDRAPFVFNCGTMREDHHAVFERCVAGRNRMWFSDNVNQADPATADWFQSVVMTECGNIDAQTPASFENGAALLKLV